LLGNEFFVFNFYYLTIVVKDTSLRRRCGPSSLSTVLLSFLDVFLIRCKYKDLDYCWRIKAKILGKDLSVDEMLLADNDLNRCLRKIADHTA
jgi:hypothetical protein